MKIRFNSASIIFTTLVSASGIVALAGCSADSSTPVSSVAPSAVAGAIATATSAITSANPVKYSAPVSSTSYNGGNVEIEANAGMTNSWFTNLDTSVSNLYCGGGSVCGGAGQPDNNSSPKKWLANMLDPAFTSSGGSSVGLMGRLAGAVGLPCVVGQIMGGSGLPAVGSTSLTVTPAAVVAANTVCGSNLSITQSFTTTITVTDVSANNGGLFDRRLVVVTPDGSTQDLFIKTGAMIRIMTTQNNTAQGYPYFNRYYVDYDTATKIGRFEGIERGFPSTNGQTAGFYFYRMWVNQSTNEVRIMGQNGGLSYAGATLSRSQSVMVGGSGNFKQQFATFEILNSTGAGITAGEDNIGCIDMNVGTVSSSSACTGAGRTFDLNTNAYAVVNTTVYGINTLGGWTKNETIAAPTFDDTSIFSAAPMN
jgi:hypothetical protein